MFVTYNSGSSLRKGVTMFADLLGILVSGLTLMFLWRLFFHKPDLRFAFWTVWKTAFLTRLGLIPTLVMLLIMITVTSNWPVTFGFGLARGIIYASYLIIEFYLTDLRLNGRKLWGIFF